MADTELNKGTISNVRTAEVMICRFKKSFLLA